MKNSDPIIPKEVRKVSLLETKNLIEQSVKLMEETGELAAEVLRYKGLKGNNGKTTKEIVDAIHLESVDVMLMAMSILVKSGATDKVIKKIIDKQLKRWQNKTR